MDILSILSLGGVRKNLFLDCWEFVPSVSVARTPQVEETLPEKELEVADLERQMLSQSIVEKDEVRDESPTYEQTHESLESASSKKKQRKKRKSTKSTSAKVSVTWGNVKEVCFHRSIGYDSVPSNGTYPLGLGDVIDESTYHVDDYSKIVENSLLPSVISPPPSPIGSPDQNKSGKGINKKRDQPSSNHNTHTSGSNNTHQPSSRRRKDSFDYAAEQDTSTTVKAKSQAPKATHEYERQMLLQRHCVDNQQLQELIKEIKQIQKSREQTGCSCKPLKLDKMNVPTLKKELLHRQIQQSKTTTNNTPEDTNKPPAILIPIISPQKIDKMKKAELIAHLKEYTKQEDCQLCRTNECECVVLEIPCSMMACLCIRYHHTTGEAGSVSPTEDGGEESPDVTHDQQTKNGEISSCGNPFGKDLFDPPRVQQYRQQVLASMKTHGTLHLNETIKY
jgi:hypothetical protein